MCFFLLSGFVIYYSIHQSSDQSFRDYFIRRFRRIYPILVIALLISYLVGLGAGVMRPNYVNLLGNLFMLQDFGLYKPGVWIDTFNGNLPLWSLSYEWWFYMMFFPIYRFVPARFQLPLVAMISFLGLGTYIAFPNQLSLFALYFILWWTGLEFARTYCQGIKPTFATQLPSLSVLGLFCVLVPVGMFFLMPPSPVPSPGFHPFLETRHFLACFVFSIAALLWSSARWKYFSSLFGIFTWVAPISYALYAFHYPLCVISRNIPEVGHTLIFQMAAIALTFALAYLVEVVLQKGIVRVTNRWFLQGKQSA